MLKTTLKTIIIYGAVSSQCLGMDEDIPTTHPLVQKVLKEEAAFRTATGQSIQALMNDITGLYQNHNAPDPEKLQQKVQKRIKKDLELLALLNEKIKALKVGTEVTYPLVTHKMIEAIGGARTFLIDPECFFDLLEGKVPEGYKYQSEKVTYLAPNKETIYGDSKGTFLKTALFYMVCVLKRSIAQHDNFENKQWEWANTSPSYHITPLPKKISRTDFIALDHRFAKFPYFLKGDEAWPEGYFFFAHSGYAFGGDTNNPHFPHGKLYGPEDCSSAISKWLRAPLRFSTYDQLYGYRYNLPENDSYVPPEWPESLEGEYFKTNLSPVVIYDPSQDIKAGQVHVHRTFSEGDPTMTKTAGEAGHTTLVVGVKENTVLTLNYARGMPDFEGFGLKEFPYESRFPKKVMFFEPKL